MSKIHYVPAGMEQLFVDGEIDLIDYLETDYILVNYLCFKNKSIEDWKKHFDRIRQSGKKIIMDSGGFQLIADPKLRINPKEVFNYQSELSDMGFILDVPLFEMKYNNGVESLTPVTNKEEINNRMLKTIQNVNDIKGLDKKESELFLIVHGNTPKEYYDWFMGTKDSNNYDGVSLKTKTIPQFVMSFFTVYKHDYKKFHALGTSALDIIPLFYYVFTKAKADRVTYDSSNSLQYSLVKRMLMDIIYLKNKSIHITETKITKTSCRCKMCEKLNYDVEDFKGKRNNSLTIHNTNVMNKYNDFIDMLSQDPKLLREWSEGRFPKLKIWFEIIDKCFEECDNSNDDFYKIFDEKLKRYHSYFNIKEAVKQQNVFEFF
jgi:hypothetical protein